MSSPFSRLSQLRRSLGNRERRFFAKSVATLTAGFLGTALYAKRAVHVDDKGLDDNISAVYRNFSKDVKARMEPLQSYPYDITLDRLKAHNTLHDSMWRIDDASVGIRRIDSISLPNMMYRKDSISNKVVNLTDLTYWTFFAMCDGFDDWATSNFIHANLIPVVMSSLLSTLDMHSFPPERRPPPFRDESYAEGVDRTIKEAFLEVDDAIVKEGYKHITSSPSPSAAAHHLFSAVGGASVLLFFYDTALRRLRIALTGDARAVLGRPVYIEQEGRWRWEVHVLTADQTLNSPAEQVRLGPAYNDPVIRERLHGLERPVSRAFGVAALKWSREMQERVHRDYMGDPPVELPDSTATISRVREEAGKKEEEEDVPPQLHGPPYFTALPEVTSIQIEPGDFLVMATCGLWKSLTNEEAVGLVGAWLERETYDTGSVELSQPAEAVEEAANATPSEETPTPHPEDALGSDANSTLPPSPPSPTRPPDSEYVLHSELPVIFPKENVAPSAPALVDPGYGSTPLRHRWKVPKDRFICTDENAAVHLTRNALGGADRDLTAALLRMNPPISAKYW